MKAIATIAKKVNFIKAIKESNRKMLASGNFIILGSNFR